MPLAQLKMQGCKVTNGAGINAITIAEYVIMGMLTVAKGYRDVVRAGYRGMLKGAPVVIPGALNRILVFLLRLAPRRAVTAVVRRLQARTPE